MQLYGRMVLVLASLVTAALSSPLVSTDPVAPGAVRHASQVSSLSTHPYPHRSRQGCMLGPVARSLHNMYQIKTCYFQLSIISLIRCDAQFEEN